MLEDAGTAVATEAEFEQDPQDFYDGLPQASQDLWDQIGGWGYEIEHADGIGFTATNRTDRQDFFGPIEKLSELYREVQAAVEGRDEMNSRKEEEPELATEGTEANDLEDHINAQVIDDGGHYPDDPVDDSGEEHPADLTNAKTSTVYCGTPSPKDDGKFCRLDLGHEGACKMTRPVDPDAVVELAANSKGQVYLPGQAPIVDQQIADAAGKYHAIKTERVALTAKETAARDELVAICHIKPELFTSDPDNTNSKIYKVGDLVVRISEEKKEKITTEVEHDG